ncbi:MAG: DUF2326 domain-containing protein [Clostridioides difficile]|nr:DUF2326 domain-containing protein [Clostridioides difficile]
MKLSKIYSSNDEIFSPIYFNDKLNIILARITMPENKKKTSHSLGKTSLAILIDFCLLKGKNKTDFMWKRYDIFKEFDFYLELLLDNGKYCTIKRSVDAKQKIYIKVHEEKHSDLTELDAKEWDIAENITKAQAYLDKVLNFNVLEEYGYRKTLSYYIRRPQDFLDEFQLAKNKLSKSYEWKSPLLRLCGFSENIFKRKYDLDKELEELIKEKKRIERISLNESEQEKRLKLIIKEKEEKLLKIQNQYDNFNFYSADIEKPKEIVNNIDDNVTRIVKENYYLESKINHSRNSVKNYDVNLEDIKKFYDEIKIYFKDDLIKEYKDVIEFNKKVTEERNLLINELLNDYSNKYEQNCKELEKLNQERQKLIQYINENEIMEKFKILQNDIISLKTEISTKKEKLESLNEGNAIDKELNEKILQHEEISKGMNYYLNNNTIFEKEKDIFNKVMKEVIGDIGLLDIKLNGNKNPDFISEIIDTDSNSLSAKDEGTSFKKLMCCAFDLAVLIAYSKERYFHFVYHDGIFDGLDNRQKDNYLKLVDKICEKYDIQYIFTCIEDELPPMINDTKKINILHENKVIILELNDSGDLGRLFKMPAF